MNKETLSKLIDFLVNFAVASFAVSAFQSVWWGVIPGIVSLVGVIILGKRLGGEYGYLDFFDRRCHLRYRLRSL
ncbi:hypothetical protein [Desulfovibrio sp. ZJ200]|uniref:hypothetical protein n=2 Tax=unclassified Desulfovibrio TaxID=2593640 RepID=UPI0013EBC8AE|nr:hypothetical protein [Desulfovibrio sp. ZJ200]